MNLKGRTSLAATLCFCSTAWTSTCLAQESALAPPSLDAEQAESQEGDQAVFHAFALLAKKERLKRLAGGASGTVFGAATMGVGSFIANQTETSKTPWLVIGGVTAGFSLLSLLVPSDTESLAHELSLDSQNSVSAAQARLLEQRWATLANEAHTERMAGGVVSLLLGAGSLATGIAFAAGAGNLSANEQATVGGLLMGGGVMFLSGGAYGLLVESDIESSYAQYTTSQGEAPTSLSQNLQLKLGAAPNGFFVGARGQF